MRCLNTLPITRLLCIHRYFDDPGNAGLPYESAEGGWQGTTYYTYEVFDEIGFDFPKDKDSRLYNAISNGVDNDLWSEAEPYMLSPDQQLTSAGSSFAALLSTSAAISSFRRKKEAASGRPENAHLPRHS
ncbi:MAG: HEPN-associated N-terminal domain-containing protein [Methylocella sp.]